MISYTNERKKPSKLQLFPPDGWKKITRACRHVNCCYKFSERIVDAYRHAVARENVLYLILSKNTGEIYTDH